MMICSYAGVSQTILNNLLHGTQGGKLQPAQFSRFRAFPAVIDPMKSRPALIPLSRPGAPHHSSPPSASLPESQLPDWCYVHSLTCPGSHRFFSISARLALIICIRQHAFPANIATGTCALYPTRQVAHLQEDVSM